jgi:hypothetical protein
MGAQTLVAEVKKHNSEGTEGKYMLMGAKHPIYPQKKQ